MAVQHASADELKATDFASKSLFFGEDWQVCISGDFEAFSPIAHTSTNTNCRRRLSPKPEVPLPARIVFQVYKTVASWASFDFYEKCRLTAK